MSKIGPGPAGSGDALAERKIAANGIVALVSVTLPLSVG